MSDQVIFMVVFQSIKRGSLRVVRQLVYIKTEANKPTRNIKKLL
jgi:hypothetical protein